MENFSLCATDFNLRIAGHGQLFRLISGLLSTSKLLTDAFDFMDYDLLTEFVTWFASSVNYGPGASDLHAAHSGQICEVSEEILVYFTFRTPLISGSVVFVFNKT